MTILNVYAIEEASSIRRRELMAQAEMYRLAKQAQEGSVKHSRPLSGRLLTLVGTLMPSGRQRSLMVEHSGNLGANK